ncbi:MAG: copper binding protein plastocyanin/azurin family protein [Actinobacteria bacterium]|nr:copper binding protein plastocyanin/azurin family protein [Actinomycetota bacterium]
MNNALLRQLRRPPTVAVALLAVGVFGACSGPKTSSAPAAPAAQARVTIVSDAATIGAFTPPSVTASVGQTVAWVFQDTNPHTVTADDDSFTSPNGGLANGKTYSHTFDKAGTYKYHCFIHPQMLGTVVVR